MLNPKVGLAALVAAVVLAAATSAGVAEDIDAGPIWNNADAQGKCPNVCTAAGGNWNGNWVTTVPGQNSVCKCDIRHDRPRARARDFNAGPIWNQADAQTKCPAVCTSHDRTWNGNWRTTQAGQMSTCSCSR